MEELAGWKPFKNVDPSMTDTTLECGVQSIEAWLRDVEHLQEGKDYVKRLAGAWTEFHVTEDLHDALVASYVAYLMNQAGGEAEFNLRNAYKYPLSHGRGVHDLPAIQLRSQRNPGKRDKHSGTG
jgi:hypothetical protein